jgi:Fasciclin domain
MESFTGINMMTLLMPTDPAFLDRIDTVEEIDNVLQNHVFLDLVFMDEWQNWTGYNVKSMNGNEWLVEAEGGSIFLLNAAGDRVRVYGDDELFENGVVHFVDSFLIESSQSLSSASPTIQEGDRTPPLLMNVSFLAFNRFGGSARDLSTPVNANKLNRALDTMIESVVSNLETPKRRRLRNSLRRRLAVSLVPESSEVYGLSDADCSEYYDGVPAGSSCQKVFAHYKLQLEGENEQEVEKKYEAAIQKAIEKGALQKSLDQVDPTFIYDVAAIDAAPVPSSDSTKMEWWVILIIVLGCLCGVCGVFCIGAYFMAPLEQGKSADEELEAPLMRGSLPEGTSDQSKDEPEDSSAHTPSNVHTSLDDGTTPDEYNIERELEEDRADVHWNGIDGLMEQENETKEGGELVGNDEDEVEWEYCDNLQGEDDAENEGDEVHFAEMTNNESAKVKPADDAGMEEEDVDVEGWDDEDQHAGAGDEELQREVEDEAQEGVTDQAIGKAAAVLDDDVSDNGADDSGDDGQEADEQWVDEDDTELPHDSDHDDHAVLQSDDDDNGGDVMISPAMDGSSEDSEFFDANDNSLTDLNFFAPEPASMESVTEQQAREPTVATTEEDTTTTSVATKKAYASKDENSDDDNMMLDDDDDDEEVLLGIHQLRSELEEIDRRASETFDAHSIKRHTK